MPWWITDGVLHRTNEVPTEHSILTKITGWGTVVIPSGVTEIADKAFRNCPNIKRVEIPDSVKRIGNRAFRGCADLEHVCIPEGVESIGEEAFYACLNLKVVELPMSLTRIGGGVFGECRQLTRIFLDQRNPHFRVAHDFLISKEGALLWSVPHRETAHVPEGVTAIGKGVFEGCRSLKYLRLPASLQSIGESAFFWCENLTSVKLSDGLTHIGENAFSYCRNLTKVVLSDGISEISDSLFEGCTNLAKVHMPSSVTHIGARAFRWCDALTYVNLPESLTQIGEKAFQHCSRLSDVVIPKGVTVIGDQAFHWCGNLKKLVIPDGITEVGCYALEGIEYLRFPTGVWESVSRDTLRAAQVIACPISLKDVPANMRLKLCIGFANAQEKYSEELRTEYCAHIGKNAAKLMQAAFEYPNLLYLMCREKLIQAKHIDAFAEEAARRGNTELTAAILDYQANALTMHSVSKARARRERVQEKQDETVIDRMAARADRTGIDGLNLAVTGHLNHFKTRAELKVFIEAHGGKLQSSMSAKTDYLITNDADSQSAKNQRAVELGILTMSEHEFLLLAEGKKKAGEVRGVTMI